VKGLEKLTPVRLAEVLTQKGTVPTEVITDALYAQDKQGEPFVQMLVGSGAITEWDLAKAVTEHFQLPFLMASNYTISDAARDKLPRNSVFQHLIVPIDVFNDVVCVVMPILTPFDTLMRIQKEINCDLYPYVGLISENKKVVSSLFPDYPAWAEKEQQRREAEATRQANARSKAKGAAAKGGGPSAGQAPDPGQPGSGEWMSIFDAGDQAIQDMIATKKKR
jgi:hypothetical protein